MNTRFVNFISRHAMQILLSALSCITFDVLSQPNWPIKPITLIVPYAAGGGHDSMARILAERLTSRLGQTVIVENKAGANGMIGAEYVAKALPDGYTVLFASPAEIVISPIAYKSMRYDPVKDLLPVTLAGLTPLVVVAHPGTGLKTIAELVALAKAQPNKLSYGTSGNLSTAAISLCSRCDTSIGARAGKNTPIQCVASKPLRPCVSLTVGRSFAHSARSCWVTANGINLPARI